jgi:hypothetical protein
MNDREGKSAAMQAFSAGFPPTMPIEQKVVLTILFACTEGQERPIEEPHAELAALCGMELVDYFATLLQLRTAGIITDDSIGLRVDRAVIRNARAIDERAGRAAKRVKGRS